MCAINILKIILNMDGIQNVMWNAPSDKEVQPVSLCPFNTNIVLFCKNSKITGRKCRKTMSH